MIRAARVFVVLSLAATSAHAQPAGRITITEALADAGSGTITIAGSGFTARPLVTLDLVPLDVQLAIESRVVAVAPIANMPAGKYLLTVSQGPEAPDSASIQVSLGAVVLPNPSNSSPLGAGGLAPAAGDRAATVGDRVISVGDVDREWQRTDPAGYLAIMRELDDHRRRVANTMVADELLSREAATRGVTVDALLAEEIPKRTIAMPDAAVTSLYMSLGDRTRGVTLDQLRPALRAWLQRNTEPELAKMAFVEELMKTSARADILLDAPRVEVEQSATDPVLGPATAPVTIVAFGDLQSVEYVKFVPALRRMRETFGDRIRILFKPLPTFGGASSAAVEAAACAHAQGKFWSYHDAAAKPGSLDASRLKTLAAESGLDGRAFDACLADGRFRALPARAADEAARYGIKASPAFLVNGRLAPDPPAFLPPVEFFKRLIEEELQRQARAARDASKAVR